MPFRQIQIGGDVGLTTNYVASYNLSGCVEVAFITVTVWSFCTWEKFLHVVFTVLTLSGGGGTHSTRNSQGELGAQSRLSRELAPHRGV